LAAPKVGAKRELLFNKPAFEHALFRSNYPSKSDKASIKFKLKQIFQKFSCYSQILFSFNRLVVKTGVFHLNQTSVEGILIVQKSSVCI
jgi:hypothetical protein